MLTNRILAAMLANPYGLTAAALAHELLVPKAEITRILTALVEVKTLVDYKVAKNHRMYSLPHTCGWSTCAAKLANIEAKAA